MYVIEQPIPLATAADSAANVLAVWNVVYDAYNEVACLMLGSMTPELHRQFENSSSYEMLQELKSMFEKQAGVERNYNMHNMRKTIGELHALLIEYEKGYPKETMGYYFYFPPENKIVVARYAEFFEKNLLSQEVSGRAGELKEIQDEDTSPFEITSKIPIEVESFEPPQEEEAHVRSKWLFKKKTDMDGNVHTYKARLIVKGFTQTYGVDYEEMFSPVADIRAIRILIAIAAFYDYEIWQMDVKTAFLNGYLDEDIYMVQPEGFIDPKHPRKVCKLQRSIYGLKQASRSWNKRFDEKIKRFGFTQNFDEPCVYQKASGRNVIFLILYVDDIIIMGNHILSFQSVKAYLGKYFAMKDLGEAAFILGIKIYRDRSRRLIGLCQSAYMDKILKRYRMDNSKRGYIPMQERLDLNKTQGASTPREVKRMQIIPYASAIVDWKSSKKRTTAMSATEAEYIAASEAGMEAVWIKCLFQGLRVNLAYYGLEECDPESLSSFLSSLVQNTFEDLEGGGCNQMNEVNVKSSMLSKVASCRSSFFQVFLNIISAASEYDELHVRHNEVFLNILSTAAFEYDDFLSVITS
nr:retrotransposon protein, putative, Ty1-copia subclass [Tanacetum cinerariifolium]